MTDSHPLPTHHHGDGRRCEWSARFGWTFDGGPEWVGWTDDGRSLCLRQDHPSGNAEVAR